MPPIGTFPYFFLLANGRHEISLVTQWKVLMFPKMFSFLDSKVKRLPILPLAQKLKLSLIVSKAINKGFSFLLES